MMSRRVRQTRSRGESRPPEYPPRRGRARLFGPDGYFEKPKESPWGNIRAPYTELQFFVSKARRSFGVINLDKDPSNYLNPTKEIQANRHLFPANIFSDDLDDLAESHQGCLIQYSLKYFQQSNQVIQYVDVLLKQCFIHEYVMFSMTKNFVILSEMANYGNAIKRQVIFRLLCIGEDVGRGLHRVAFGNLNISNIYPINVLIGRFYKLVNLLYFRFLDMHTLRRDNRLASFSFAGLQYFLKNGSLKLLIELFQLNFHELGSVCSEYSCMLEKDICPLMDKYRFSNQNLFFWLSSILEMMKYGPILPQDIYDLYMELLGQEWAVLVKCSPLQILDPMLNDFILEVDGENFQVEDKWDCLFTNYSTRRT